MKHTPKYLFNKAAKVGTYCTCPNCGTKFIKGSYQQAFCKVLGGTVCKDGYWNQVDPKKRNNTTRISPASRAWMEERENERLFSDDDQGWDAHKDSF